MVTNNRSDNAFNCLQSIETPRLVIRPVQLGDELALNACFQNSLSQLQEWLPWAKDPSIVARRRFIQNSVYDRLASSSVCAMVMILKQGLRIIGGIGFNDGSRSQQKLYEIGYWCDKDHQGHGYVTECVQALAHYAFIHLSAREVHLQILLGNRKSEGVAKRLGFKFEATVDREPEDCVEGKPKQYGVYIRKSMEGLASLSVSVQEDDNHQNTVNMIAWAKRVLIQDYKLQVKSGRAVVMTPWSKVFEMNTGEGLIYFKETPPQFFGEPDILNFCSQKLGVHVPTVMAVNHEGCCFLMKGAGFGLRALLSKSFDHDLLLRAVSQFADFQSKAADHGESLLALGLADYRVETLVDCYQALMAQESLLIKEGFGLTDCADLQALSSKIEAVCHRVMQTGIQSTVVQLDFNDNNTVYDESSDVLTMLDFGELVWSHPLLSMLNMLEQIQKHYGFNEGDVFYQKLHAQCLQPYTEFLGRGRALDQAIDDIKVIRVLVWALYQLRFADACGKEALMQSGQWRLKPLLQTLLQRLS